MFENFNKDQNKTAIILDNGEKISYKKIIKDSDSIIKSLEKKKSLVFIFCENNYETVISYVACLRSNHVPYLIDSLLPNEKISDLIKLYKPNYLICKKKKFNFIDKLKEKKNKFNYMIFETKFKNNSINDKLFLLLGTSGTTGDPKLVRLSEKNLKINTDQIIDYLKIDNSHRSVSTLPIYYTYGLSILNTHLCGGASIYLTKKTFFEKIFWNNFNKFKVNNFGGVPFNYQMLLKLNFDKINTKYLKYITQAGGKLNDNDFDKIEKISEEKKIKFFSMYGQTEATSRMSFIPWDKIKSMKGTIGKPVKGAKFFLYSDEKKIEKINKEGEIIFQGKNVCLGYSYNSNDLSKGDENKGLLRTGDIGIYDHNKNIRITGRKSRFIKVYGFRINLDEIEKTLVQNGFECACLGKNDKLLIFHTQKNIEKKIYNILKEKLNLLSRDISITNIKVIPRSKIGKIDYKKLNEIR
tara:strand:- start:26941 stop:28341 length:1401 start_codon:yes stop_codon:yes gene_type:complete